MLRGAIAVLRGAIFDMLFIAKFILPAADAAVRQPSNCLVLIVLTMSYLPQITAMEAGGGASRPPIFSGMRDDYAAW